MDNSNATRPRSTIAGIGSTVLLLIVQKWVVEMPNLVLGVGIAVCVGFILYGIWSYIPFIGKFRLDIKLSRANRSMLPAPQPVSHPLAIEYQRLADADLAHMDTRVIVYAVMHSAAIREQQKPFIEFIFSIFNGCVFPVRIDTKTEGRVKGNAVPLDLSPDVLNTAGYDDPVQHGHGHILKMRQYLSDQETNQLCNARKEGWETVPFDFTGLTVWIFPEIPDGKRKRLALRSPILIPQRELFL